jgi:hypothetical protein
LLALVVKLFKDFYNLKGLFKPHPVPKSVRFYRHRQKHGYKTNHFCSGTDGEVSGSGAAGHYAATDEPGRDQRRDGGA